MTYTAAAALGVIAAFGLDLAVLRTRLVLSRVFWLSYVIILGFQLALNGVLTNRGVVRYDPAAIVGWRIAYAPVEDVAFGFALVLTSLALWIWWERRTGTGADTPRTSAESP
jgi:lycopene cyclase domain-containing protein